MGTLFFICFVNVSYWQILKTFYEQKIVTQYLSPDTVKSVQINPLTACTEIGLYVVHYRQAHAYAHDKTEAEENPQSKM
jgi:hypothetical protein